MTKNIQDKKKDAERKLFNAIGKNYSIPYLNSVIAVELFNYITINISIDVSHHYLLVEAMEIGVSVIEILESGDLKRIHNLYHRIDEYAQIASKNGRNDLSSVFKALHIAIEKILKVPNSNYGLYLKTQTSCEKCSILYNGRYSLIIEESAPEISTLEELNQVICPICGQISELSLPLAYINRTNKTIFLLFVNEEIPEWLTSYFNSQNIDIKPYHIKRIMNKEKFIQLIEVPEEQTVNVRITDLNTGICVSGLRLIAAKYSDESNYQDAIRCYNLCCNLEPQNPENWIGLGANLNEVGEKQQALKIMRQAKELEKSQSYIAMLKPTKSVQKIPDHIAKNIIKPQTPNDEDIKKMWNSAIIEIKSYLKKYPDDINISLLHGFAAEQINRLS